MSAVCADYLYRFYTALSLQILSNLANDLGDGIRGTDQDRHHAPPQSCLFG
ncbi:hypothetical protein LU290_08585 [Moraxella nasibovis]|uniref:hypothetical protein n=1 Tax=Moraxella nasibovis TaxID=2904120 RepID=UPI00240FB326|nr:hypothetical protein [Moraxella nasibovis]WFF38296.1 hypothetical protein LU290_08585 [Moraxella nasibovis]